MPPSSKHASSVVEPYPGLRSYNDREALFFAGRDEDITTCALLLVEARVLVLHGRTGCGKSSFLRAGVKPRVSSYNLGLDFSEGFVVIRSTADPLRQLITRVLRMADSLLTKGDSEYGKLDRFSDPTEMREELKAKGVRFGEDGRITPEEAERFATAPQLFVDVLSYLGGSMKGAPIFVIDQGEEVFTMADEASPSGTSPKSKADVGRNPEAVQFFKFLHRFTTHGSESRIVISLRTEYKGLFDDRIAENSSDGIRRHPGPDLAGFYLKELEREELEKAILRPTLKRESAEWQELLAQADGSGRKAPFDEFGFSIEKGVVAELAGKLLGEDIPSGGVLPAMQVACLRLWRQVRNANRLNATEEMLIKSIHLRRLGAISDQVSEYLIETIEEVCNIPLLSDRVAEATVDWMRTLYNLMVKVEADGRAVTRAVPLKDLKQRLMDSLFSKEEDQQANTEQEIDNMIDILRSESRDILKRDSDGDLITLGHDSLALALRQWAIQNPRSGMSMMMRMGMGGIRNPEDLQAGDLFLAEDPPHKVTIYAHQDYVWDRHLPQFAARYNFAERLGITLIVDDPELDALAEEGIRPSNWAELSDRIRAKDEEFDGRRYNSNNNRIMVAADWNSFPGPKRIGKDGRDERNKFAHRFSDILVTDISVGNQLIGPYSREVDDAQKKLEQVDHSKRFEAMKELLTLSLQKLVEKKGIVFCYDQSGRDLLDFAARFIGDAKLRNYVNEHVETLPAENYGPTDPLVARLLGETRGTSRGKGKQRDHAGNRFIVGTAFPYAMALHCGYVSYFGTKHLSDMSKLEMERRQTVGYEARIAGLPAPDYSKDLIPDLTLEMQKIVSHTLWQLGIEPNKWSSGLNRAMVLRFASVGYFTSEFVRTNMDKYIAYIHELVSRTMAMENDRVDAVDRVGSARMSQKAVKEAIQSCFGFLRFDDFGTEVYDLDARLAYWSDHGSLNTKSVAGEIYAELVRLRQRTIENFSLTAQSIAWMRVSGDYHPGNRRVSLAYRMKELAWNNFRIFNFYDSDRYMSLAAHLLQEEMEGVFRKDSLGALRGIRD